MTATATPKQRWNTGAHLSIRSASYDCGLLKIRFADGDDVAIPVARFALGRLVSAEWPRVTAGPLWITVPTAKGDVEISWLAIGLLTDPEFNAFWGNRSEAGDAQSVVLGSTRGPSLSHR